VAYEPDRVDVLSDEDGTGYTATCPQGHTSSGALPARTS
jgi:hypothetical protein